MHSLNVGALLIALLCLVAGAASATHILAAYEAVLVPFEHNPSRWTIPRRRNEHENDRVQKRACEPLDTDCGNGFCCQALYTCSLPRPGSGGDTQCEIGGLLGLLPGSEEPAYADSPPSPSPPSPLSPPPSKHSPTSSSKPASSILSSTSTSASSTTTSSSSVSSSTSTSSSTSRAPTATSSATAAAAPAGLSGGAIAGIVIGVFAAVAVLAALASALYNWYRNKNEHETLGSISGDHSASEMRNLGDAYGSSGPGASGGAAAAAAAAATTTGAAMAAASGSAFQAKSGGSVREKALPPLSPDVTGLGARSQGALPQYQEQQNHRPLATMPNFGPVMEMDGGGLGNQAPRAEMMGDMPVPPASGAGTQRQLSRRPVPGSGGSRSVPRKSVYEMPG